MSTPTDSYLGSRAFPCTLRDPEWKLTTVEQGLLQEQNIEKLSAMLNARLHVLATTLRLYESLFQPGTFRWTSGSYKTIDDWVAVTRYISGGWPFNKLLMMDPAAIFEAEKCDSFQRFWDCLTRNTSFYATPETRKVSHELRKSLPFPLDEKSFSSWLELRAQSTWVECLTSLPGARDILSPTLLDKLTKRVDLTSTNSGAVPVADIRKMGEEFAAACAADPDGPRIFGDCVRAFVLREPSVNG